MTGPLPVFLQDPQSSTCGQTCIAMLLRLSSVDEACKLIGKKGGTRTKDLVKALRAHGWTCSTKRVRLRPRALLPQRAILFAYPKGRRKKCWRHWIIIWEGSSYDPSFGRDTNLGIYDITSYIEISPP